MLCALDLLSGVTTSDGVVCFEVPRLFDADTWHNVTVVLQKSGLLRYSSVSLYVNGDLHSSDKVCARLTACFMRMQITRCDLFLSLTLCMPWLPSTSNKKTPSHLETTCPPPVGGFFTTHLLLLNCHAKRRSFVTAPVHLCEHPATRLNLAAALCVRIHWYSTGSAVHPLSAGVAAGPAVSVRRSIHPCSSSHSSFTRP